MTHWNRKEIALVIFIVAVAAGLRLWSNGYDLPYLYHPDEPAIIRVAINMFHTGDQNTHFFGYPSLMFYVHEAGYALYYGFGRLTGTMTTRMDVADLSSIAMGASFATDPMVIMIGRFITLLFGVATVVMVYLIGRRLSGRWVGGTLAAMLLAVYPPHIYHSRLITFDAPATFFAVWAAYGALLILQEGRTRHYAVAAIAVGLAAASKYNVAIVAIVIPAAHFLRAGAAGWRDKRLYGTALVAALAFLVTNPYAILDYPGFSAKVFASGRHYSRGHEGMEGDTVRWYLNYLWTTASLLPILALLQIVIGAVRRSKQTILLASFPLLYFLFISSFDVRNDRTLLPVVPFVFLLAATLLADWGRAAQQIENRTTRRLTTAGLVIVTAALLLMPARSTVAINIQRQTEALSGPLAGQWIMTHVPPGSRIAMESYGPYFDPSAFDLQVINGLVDHPPQWYIDEGFDFLVFSQGSYGRFFRDPERYPEQIVRYEELFASFELVQKFRSESTEILIYRVNR